jgi:hypothetical protein
MDEDKTSISGGTPYKERKTRKKKRKKEDYPFGTETKFFARRHDASTV